MKITVSARTDDEVEDNYNNDAENHYSKLNGMLNQFQNMCLGNIELKIKKQ